MQANCIYEACCFLVDSRITWFNDFVQGVYLLGTSLARPVIARSMIAVAERENCECVLICKFPPIQTLTTAPFHAASSLTAALAKAMTKSVSNLHSMPLSPASKSSRLGDSLNSTTASRAVLPCWNTLPRSRSLFNRLLLSLGQLVRPLKFIPLTSAVLINCQ